MWIVPLNGWRFRRLRRKSGFGEAPRNQPRKAEYNDDACPGFTTDERQRLQALEWENLEVRGANVVL